MIVFEDDSPPDVAAATDVHAMLLGGAPIEGERLVWWNFVASSEALMEKAKTDWKTQRFDTIPGETEYIPLPED